MPLPSELRSPWFLFPFFAVTLIKLAALAVYPDTGFPDRHLYLAYADILLSQSDWFVQMEHSALPVTGFRAIGYPLILAAGKLLAGEGFGVLIRCLQVLAALGAAVLVYRASFSLTDRRWTAALGMLSFALSVALAYELSYLPDSLTISAWVGILAMAVLIARDRSLTKGRLLFIALSAIVVIGLRGNGLHLLMLLSPVFIAGLWRTKKSRARHATLLILAMLPGLVFYNAIAEWNRYRTGERFFTTGAQIALVQPVFEMARRGARPFDGNTPYATAIRTHAPDLHYEQIYDVNRSLFTDHGMTPKEIADTNIRHYLETVVHNPGVFAEMWIGNFDDKFALGLINPAFGLHQAHQLVTGDRVFPGFSKIVKNWDGSVSALGFALVYGLGLILSVVIFLAALVGTPIRVWCDRKSQSLDWLIAGTLWLACLGVIAYYCALFVELRYLIMLNPFLTLLGLWACFSRRRVENETVIGQDS